MKQLLRKFVRDAFLYKLDFPIFVRKELTSNSPLCLTEEIKWFFGKQHSVISPLSLHMHIVHTYAQQTVLNHTRMVH